MLKGWKRYRDYPDPRVRERFEREVVKLRSGHNAVLWAMEHQFRSINASVSERIRSLRKQVEQERGGRALQFPLSRPVHAVDVSSRKAPLGCRQNLRANYVC
jgi:hypothetical protein